MTTLIQSRNMLGPAILAGLLDMTNALHVRNSLASGTAGGGITTSYVTRLMNTTVLNNIAGASLNTSTGVVTLPAGNYFVMAKLAGFNCGQHKSKLVNLTDTVDLVIGSAEQIATAGSIQGYSWVIGYFTLAASKNVGFQTRAGTAQATNGLGAACTFGDAEIYVDAIFFKVG